MSSDLVLREAPQPISEYMPIMSIDQAIQRRQMLVEYTRRLMVDGQDFGKIPGAGDKPTLLKPGAEKLCTIFGLTPQFEIVKQIEQWESEGNAEPLFYYIYRCSLYRGDRLLATGDGSCNSREKKYRYRKAERVCPACGVAAIIKGRAEYGGGWVCFDKKGGCKTKFKDGDASIEAQEVGQIFNPDIADLINTLMKMAQKRAFIAATLIGVNASEFFTQDLDDISHDAPVHVPEDYHDPEPPARAPKPAPIIVEDPITTRRNRALNTFKDHFDTEKLTLCLPPESILDVHGKPVGVDGTIHRGRTFSVMSEQDLEAVEVFMSRPNAPVKEKPKPTDQEAQATREAMSR